MKLNKISTDELAKELLFRRNDFFGEKKWLVPSIFELYKAMGPVVCVDGIPWRINNENEKVELMAIRRQTGPYPEKLVLIGGTIGKGEALDEALQRHFKEDLGVKIKIPGELFCMTQYRKPPPDKNWMQDPGKEHVVSPVYLVEIKDSVPQRSLAGDPIEWFSEGSMPDKEFGYTNQRIYRRVFKYISGK